AFGADAETVDALAGLLSATSAWGELEAHLAGAAAHPRNADDAPRRAELLFRLGDTQRAHLGAPGKAVASYAQSLDVEPKGPAARAGLLALLEDHVDDESDHIAAEALARAYKS